MDAVEVSAVVDVVLGPDLADHLEELAATSVALVVLEPGLAEVGELVLEPTTHHVDRKSPARQDVCGRAELGEHCGMPQSGVNGRDQLQTFGRTEESEAERRRLVLELGPVTRFVPHLAERVLESVVLGRLREALVVLEVPPGSLLDVARHESTGYVRDPIRELDLVGDLLGGHDTPVARRTSALGHNRSSVSSTPPQAPTVEIGMDSSRRRAPTCYLFDDAGQRSSDGSHCAIPRNTMTNWR